MAEVDYTSNGLVTSPVVLTAVSKLIGEATNDLGKLCKSDKINPFSKRKPLRCEGIALADSDDVWEAHDWGFWIPPGVIMTQLASWVAGGSLPWETEEDDDAVYIPNSGVWRYLKPKGGSTSPYRLGDFRGYDHNTGRTNGSLSKATLFEGIVRGVSGSDLQLPQSDTIVCSKFSGATFILNTSLYDFASFTSIKDKYFGVLVVDTSSPSSVKCMTCAIALSGEDNPDLQKYHNILKVTAEDLSVLFPTLYNNDISGKVYKVLFIASDTAITYPSLTQRANIIPLPFNSFYMGRHLATANLTVSVSAVVTNNNKTLSVRITFRNDGGYSDAYKISVTLTYNSFTQQASPATGTVIPINDEHTYTINVTPGSNVNSGDTCSLTGRYADAEGTHEFTKNNILITVPSQDV